MADTNNPIKYSDLIKPDNSITDLIAQLEKLMQTYSESAEKLKGEAVQVKASIQGVSGATEQGRTATRNASTEAERLAKAQQQLSMSTSNTAVEIARLKQAQKEANDIAKLTAKLNEAEEGSYNRLSAQYALNKMRLNAMSAEMRKGTQEGRALEAETERIYQEMKALQEATGKYTLNVGNYESGAKSLRTQLRELTLQMAELASQGQKGSEQWNALAQQAGAIKDAMNDANTAVGKFASDYKVLDDVISVAEVGTSAFGVYTSTLQVFGEQNEEVAESIRKLQAVQTMLVSLQTLAKQLTTDGTMANRLYHASLQALNLEKKAEIANETASTTAKAKNTTATSANTVATRAESVVNKADATAKGINTVATWALTGATTALGVALKALGIGLIISAIVLLIDIMGGLQSVFELILAPIKAIGEGLSWCADKIKGFLGISSKSEKQSNANKKAMEEEADATEELARKKEELKKAMAEELAKYMQLKAQWDSLSSLKERQQFIKDYATEIQNLKSDVDTLAEAEKFFSEEGARIFKEGIEKRAKLVILQEKLIQNLKAQEEIENISLSGIFGTIAKDAQKFLEKQKADLLNEIVVIQKEIDNIFPKTVDKTVSSTAKKTGDAYVDGITEELEQGEDEIKHFYKMLEAEGKKSIDSQLEENEKLFELRRNSYTKLLAHINLQSAQYKQGSEEMKAIEQQYADYSKKLVDAQYEYEEKSLELRTKKQKDEALAQLKNEKEVIELRLQAVRSGSDEEMRLKEQQIENQRKTALAQNAMLVESAQKNTDDINAVYDEKLSKLADTWVSQQKALFDKEQELAQSEYDLLENSEERKTRFRLQAEKERIKKILELNKKAGTKLTDTEVQTLQNTIAKIDQEIEASKKKERGQDLWGVFGINIDEDKKKAIEQSIDFVKEQLSSVMEAITESADKAVEASQREVDAMQSRLDAELQARANGYASNVEQAQKDLELARKTNAKAREEQAKAQQQQQAIQSIEQMGNLVTASSLIWSQLGFPWAIPAIGAMWGSFAYAKVKAMQLTRQNSEKYGEGTVELLEGGSHQSGNDIDLGTKADGTRRRAEGGEFFAVINKRNSRKYRSIIPDVINSLNKGNFAEKYMSAFTPDGMVLNLNGNTPDIRELNDNVRAIKEQGMSRTYTDRNGRMVSQYKNVKRIYTR